MLDEEEKEHVLAFKSTFAQTVVKMVLNPGKIEIRSNNLTSITIAKDTITSEALLRKINLETSSEIKKESIAQMLDLLHPQLEQLFSLAKQDILIDGLKELENETKNDEGGLSFLSDEFKQILRNAEQIRRELKQQPRTLSYLWGVLGDLYIDSAKIMGFHNVQQRTEQLKGLLQNYERDVVQSFFKETL